MGGAGGGALWGRQDDLRRILVAAGHVVVVQGDPGIGKSRLVAEVGRAADTQGTQVIAGRVSELEATRPFGVLVDAFELYRTSVPPSLRAVAGLLRAEHPGSEGVEMPAMRYRVLDGLLSHFEDLAASGPVLLILEDLHWADPSSLLFVRHVAERFHELPVKLVATRRIIPRSADLDRIEELAGVETVRLRPLPADVVSDVAHDRFGAPPGPRLTERLRAAEGNPLFVHELLDALAATGAVSVAEEIAEVGDIGLPDSFHAAILRRLSYLPPETLQLLRLAAVLGARFEVSDLAVAADIAAADLAERLEPAFGAALLGEQGARLEFRHDLVRDAIYSDMAEGVRAAIHAQIARDLRSAGVPLERIALHVSLSAQPGDAEAMQLLLAAAHAVAARAPGLAAQLLQRSLEVAPQGHPEVPAITADLSRALLWSGDFHRAELQARQLLARQHDPELGAAVRYALARVLVYRGDLTSAVDQLHAALAEPKLSSGQAAKLQADLAIRLQVVRDPDGAARAAEQALAMAERDDALARGVALCAQSRIAAHDGRGAEAVRLAQQAVSASSSGGMDAIALLQPQLYLALALCGAQEWKGAARTAQAGLRAADAAGSAWMSPLFHQAAALAAYGVGAWDEAVAEARLSAAMAGETGVVVWQPWAAALEALVLVHRNELPAARASVADLEPVTRPRFGSDTIALAVATVQRASGDRAAALDTIRAEWESWPVDRRPAELAFAVATLAHDVGLGDVASEAVLLLQRRAEDDGSWRAGALAGQALLDGDVPAAHAALAAATEVSSPLDAASVTEVAGQCLADAGDGPAAVAALTTAADGYGELGAVHDAARVEAALRGLGVRRGRRGARNRPKSGWESLTTSELAVLDLLMEGLTNREIGERLFISRRTVDSHVSRMLGKIGVSSRVALVAEASRRIPAPLRQRRPS